MAKTALEKIQAMLDKCTELTEEVCFDELYEQESKLGKAIMVYAADDLADLPEVSTEPPTGQWDPDSFRAGMRWVAQMLINHDIDLGVLD